MSNFIHLHLHTHYSLLDGLGKIDDVLEKCKEYGMDSCAITDHGTMYGVIEFYQKALKAGIKPILGVEVYVAPRTLKDKVPKIDGTPYHLILLAKNFDGYQNIMKLVSIAHLDGYYYKPRVDKETLKKYSSGIIASSACLAGEIPHYAALQNDETTEKIIQEYVEIFGKDNFYLELQHHPLIKKQQIVNDTLIKMSKKLGIGLIATNDVHYINKDDAEAQDVLLCIQTGKFLADTDRMSMKENGEFIDISMKSPEEMMEAFKNTPEAITNTKKIADMCNVEIEIGNFKFPEFPVPDGKDYETYMKELIEERLTKTVGTITTEMRERLEYEFKVIKDKGYLGYFLIVQDFVHWAKERNIPTNTRGSAAGCFVSYSLGITAAQLNPLEYNLPFERFLNPFRPSAPDIDIDIADSSRDAIIQYVSEKYGEDRVAQICTFGTMASKAAIRDVARVLGYPYAFGDTLSKIIPTSTQANYISIKKAIEMLPELKIRYEKEDDVKRTLNLAMKLEGCARHASVHAAGVVIAPDEITKFSPVMRDTKGGRLVTQYEMHTVGEDGIGLIKMDFLGLANLTIIKDVLRIVNKTKGAEIILDKIPLDDAKTFKLLTNGETIGVFQLEGDGMRRYIKELKPTTIHDIMAMVALYRPGPMNFIPDYVARKHNPSLITYLDPRMEKILDKSLGLIVYQDDVLMIAIELAGYNWMEVDKFRKAIGKKIVSEMAAQKEKFFKQIIERGMKEDAAQELWNQIETFAGYGFNKSHAASYGLVAYQTAYLKAHYPSEFMAAWLTSEQSRDIEKVSFALQEASRMKIKVLPPDVNESYVDFGVIAETGDISYALASIKNVGRGAAEEIVEERKKSGKYNSLENFLERMGSSVNNKKILENLAKAGALDTLVERNQVIESIEEILKFASTINKDKESAQINLFGTSENTIKASLKLKDSTPATKRERLSWEKELLGLYLSGHPLGDLATTLNGFVEQISLLNEKRVDQNVRVGGIIIGKKNILTRAGETMAFVKIEDASGPIELIVFPKTYNLTQNIWQDGNIIIADGALNNKDGSLKILVNNIYQIDHDPASAYKILKSLPKLEKENNRYNFRNKNSNEKTKFVSQGPISFELAKLTLIFPKNATKNTLADIKTIIEEYPGEQSVLLRIPSDGGYKDVEAKAKVKISPVLKTRLIDILGKDNVLF
ncbi:MAG: DNA polymerase III subunit alpha [Patescibacteria group bacterium]